MSESGIRLALTCAFAAAVVAACARPLAPPGGDRDVTPPRLVSTTPEPLAVVPPADVRVVMKFDESLSERGFTESLVTVSPLDSTLRVERSGEEISVGIDGGWRPGRVYRVVLLPGVRDRFGNARNEAVELVFSTGAPIGSTALAGIVFDRLTGQGVLQGVVEAVQRPDSVRYLAVTDSTGFYSLRYLPIGDYDVLAYDDLNRNRRRDDSEPFEDGKAAAFQEPTDTVAIVFRVLAPDTTAPSVTRAESPDSLNVGIEIDDAIDPVQALGSVRAQVFAMPDSLPYAIGVRIRTTAEYMQERAAADTLAPDTIVADTAAADTVAQAMPVELEGLPVREFVVQLDRPLRPGTYTITVTGITNLHGLTGFGTTQFEVRPPPPPPDTTGLRPDTTGIPPDTIGVRRDTIRDTVFLRMR